MAHLEFEKPIALLEERIRDLQALAEADPAAQQQLVHLRQEADALCREVYTHLGVWQKVQLSRHPDRPYMLDYVERIFTDVVELHGDRYFADDPAIVSGFAKLNGASVAIIGHQKGRTTKEKVKRNFGMAHPEGYRKAMRVMELANRYGRPIITFIDTPGAYPGIGAEERGQSEAIGKSLLVMSELDVPLVAVVIGEGGSGGALALGVGNSVLMQELATYSVITPEGCASILWRDGARAPDAAEQLKLLATDALGLGVIDSIVPEPLGGAHRDVDLAAQYLGSAISGALEPLLTQSPASLRSGRYEKFRAIGQVDTLA